jgi:hypothetical protein
MDIGLRLGPQSKGARRDGLVAGHSYLPDWQREGAKADRSNASAGTLVCDKHDEF